jgi:hypothetical protein
MVLTGTSMRLKHRRTEVKRLKAERDDLRHADRPAPTDE